MAPPVPRFGPSVKALLLFALSSSLIFSENLCSAEENPTGEPARLLVAVGLSPQDRRSNKYAEPPSFSSEEGTEKRHLEKGNRVAVSGAGRTRESRPVFAETRTPPPRRRLFGEVCRTEPVRVWSTCTRVVDVQEAEPCAVEEDLPVKGLSAGKAEPSDCQRRSCVLVPVERSTSCLKKVKVQLPVACTEKKKERVCRKETRQKPATCYRDEVGTEEYACTKEQLKRQCRLAEVEVEAVCEEKQFREEKYMCERREKQKQCEQVQVPVTSLCKEVELKRFKYKCTKTEWTVVCKKRKHKADGALCEPQMPPALSKDHGVAAPVVFDSPIEKDVSASHAPFGSPMPQDAFEAPPEEDDWEEVENEEPEAEGAAESWTGDGLCSPDDPWCGRRRLGPKKKIFAELPASGECGMEEGSVCRTSSLKTEPRVCKRVPKKVAATCEGERPVERKKKCVEMQTREKCALVEAVVPSECTRSVPVAVAVPCRKKEKQRQCRLAPVQVPATCTREVSRQVAYKCMQPKEVTLCKTEIVPVEATCFETALQERREVCTTTELERQCTLESEPCAVVSLTKHKHKHVGKKYRKKRRLHSKTKVAAGVPCVRTSPVTQTFPCEKVEYKTTCSAPPKQPAPLPPHEAFAEEAFAEEAFAVSESESFFDRKALQPQP